jgi:hypothetical protein
MLRRATNAISGEGIRRAAAARRAALREGGYGRWGWIRSSRRRASRRTFDRSHRRPSAPFRWGLIRRRSDPRGRAPGFRRRRHRRSRSHPGDVHGEQVPRSVRHDQRGPSSFCSAPRFGRSGPAGFLWIRAEYANCVPDAVLLRNFGTLTDSSEAMRKRSCTQRSDRPGTGGALYSWTPAAQFVIRVEATPGPARRRTGHASPPRLVVWGNPHQL